MTRRAPRRWPRRLAYGAVALLVGVLAVFGWAWSSVDRSTIARALWWGEADVGDYFRFPARPVRAGEDASPLPSGGEIDLPARLSATAEGSRSMTSCANDTGAFLVVQEDQLVYER